MARARVTLPALELADEIKRMFGGVAMLDLGQVQKYLGHESRTSTYKWLAGMPAYSLNGRKKYRAADIAARLVEQRV